MKKTFLLLMNKNTISGNPTANILSIECKTLKTAMKKEKEARWIFEQGKGNYNSEIRSSAGELWKRRNGEPWVEA